MRQREALERRAVGVRAGGRQAASASPSGPLGGVDRTPPGGAGRPSARGAACAPGSQRPSSPTVRFWAGSPRRAYLTSCAARCRARARRAARTRPTARRSAAARAPAPARRAARESWLDAAAVVAHHDRQRPSRRRACPPRACRRRRRRRGRRRWCTPPTRPSSCRRAPPPSNVERVGQPGERLPHDRDPLRPGGQHRRTSGGGAHRAAPFPSARAASIAASRPLTTGSTGTSPVMSRIRWTPGSTASPTQTTKPWLGLERAPAGVEQRAQHRRVDEGGARQVDHDRRRRGPAPRRGARAAWGPCRCRARPRRRPRPRPPPRRRARSDSRPCGARTIPVRAAPNRA